MKRILVDLERTKYRYSGLGQYSLFLGESLLLNNSEFEFTFFCTKDIPEFRDKVDIAVPNEWGRWLGVNAPGIALWHSTWQESSYLPRNKNIPLVLTIHDLNFLHEGRSQKIEKKLQKLRKVVGRSSYVTTISQYTADLLREHIDVKVPLEVIHNGLTMKSREEASPPPLFPFVEQEYLLSLGVFLPKKNVHSLIEMMKHLPNEKLVVAGGLGDASYREELQRMAEVPELRGRIRFLGEVDGPQKRWLYLHAKAFLFPSTQEGFGLPVVEAMSCGTPVVCSNLTSLPEVGGDVAIYWKNFDPKEMASVLLEGVSAFGQKSEYRELLKANAQRFNWAESARKYLGVYSKVLVGL